jgi:hypothetical protein
VPHSIANPWQLTDTHLRRDLLQLTGTHFAGNAIACGTRLPVSRLGRYRMGYSPPRASFRRLGITT